MPEANEVDMDIVAAVGGTGAAIGASTALLSDTTLPVGLLIACSVGLLTSGGLMLLYSHFS